MTMKCDCSECCGSGKRVRFELVPLPVEVCKACGGSGKTEELTWQERKELDVIEKRKNDS